MLLLTQRIEFYDKEFPELDYLEGRWKETGYMDSQGYTWIVPTLK